MSARAVTATRSTSVLIRDVLIMFSDSVEMEVYTLTAGVTVNPSCAACLWRRLAARRSVSSSVLWNTSSL